MTSSDWVDAELVFCLGILLICMDEIRGEPKSTARMAVLRVAADVRRVAGVW